MSDRTLPKLLATPWPEILARAALVGECAAVIQDDTDAAAAISRLEAAGFLTEAAKLMAHALPRRESVWWACMCAASTAPGDLTEADQLAQLHAEQWVRRQTDELRRAAMECAESSGCRTPEAWTGIAAFWSGASIAPIGERPIAPLPQQTGSAVAAAVALAAVRGDAKRYPERLQRFLGSGRDIAAGGNGRLPAEVN